MLRNSQVIDRRRTTRRAEDGIPSRCLVRAAACTIHNGVCFTKGACGRQYLVSAMPTPPRHLAFAGAIFVMTCTSFLPAKGSNVWSNSIARVIAHRAGEQVSYAKRHFHSRKMQNRDSIVSAVASAFNRSMPNSATIRVFTQFPVVGPAETDATFAKMRSCSERSCFAGVVGVARERIQLRHQ